MVIDDEPCIVDELDQKGKVTQQISNQTDSLIVGCGFLGKTVALRLKKSFADARVFVTTRSNAKASQLSNAGLEPILMDWTDRRTVARLPSCKQVLVAVAYDPRAGYSREQSQVCGLANLLDSLAPEAHVVYISTTGVYHQQDGSWVDEFSTARPTMPGGKRIFEPSRCCEVAGPQATPFCGLPGFMALAVCLWPTRSPRENRSTLGLKAT